LFDQFGMKILNKISTAPPCPAYAATQIDADAHRLNWCAMLLATWQCRWGIHLVGDVVDRGCGSGFFLPGLAIVLDVCAKPTL
jgi:hypothetical protein